MAEEIWPVVRLGDRVRVRTGSPTITLCTNFGYIVRWDELWDGYVIVRLDRPARYDNGVAPPRWLDEIRVAIDNLDPLAPAGHDS